MPNLIRCLPLVVALACNSTKTDQPTEEWQSLWNGRDFTGWHTYFASPYSGMDKSQEGFLGLNNPDQDVIAVVELDDGPALQVSGVSWGMMFTDKAFGNYHLKLKVKWGNDMHVPRENGPRDSGLLYHGFGEPGSAYVWMSSQELQIQEGDMGDYWPTGDIAIDVPSTLNDSLFYRYKESAPLRRYYFADIVQEQGLYDSLAKRRVIKHPESENPIGEWNDIELICYGDSSIHVVNGKVVMRLFNSRKMSDNSPVRSGKIILQSEGAEVYFKDIKLKPIDKMPAISL